MGNRGLRLDCNMANRTAWCSMTRPASTSASASRVRRSRFPSVSSLPGLSLCSRSASLALNLARALQRLKLAMSHLCSVASRSTSMPLISDWRRRMKLASMACRHSGCSAMSRARKPRKDSISGSLPSEYILCLVAIAQTGGADNRDVTCW